MDKGYCKIRAGKPVELSPLIGGTYTGHWMIIDKLRVCMWKVDMNDNEYHIIAGEFPEYYEGVQGL